MLKAESLLGGEKLRILMLSWEYPPNACGGLGRAVSGLAEALARADHDVRVISLPYEGGSDRDEHSGVTVYRTTQYHPQPRSFLDAVMYFNFHLLHTAMELWHSGWHWDVLHGHDWLICPGAVTLKHVFQCPLIATVHATEWGRNNGLHNDLQRHISDIEWWLTYEAYRIVCCSQYMQTQLEEIFQVPADKVQVVPNAVSLDDFRRHHQNLEEFRLNFAQPNERLVFFVGRLVQEKGLDVLIEAIPRVLERFPQTRFVIAGEGPCGDQLRQTVWDRGLADRVCFTGYIDDLTRNSLYKTADAAVFPSRYEPFGIVALEAMAAQAPLVVSDTGGLREIVRHGRNGLTSYAGQPESLADNIMALLQAPGFARELTERAFQEVLEKYTWEAVAAQTLDLYDELMADEHAAEPTQLRARAQEAVMAFSRYYDGAGEVSNEK